MHRHSNRNASEDNCGNTHQFFIWRSNVLSCQNFASLGLHLMESLQTPQACWSLSSCGLKEHSGDFNCVASWLCRLLHGSASFPKPHWQEPSPHKCVCVCVYICVYTYIYEICICLSLYNVFPSFSVRFKPGCTYARPVSASVSIGLPSLPTHVLLNSENLQLYHVVLPMESWFNAHNHHTLK